MRPGVHPVGISLRQTLCENPRVGGPGFFKCLASNLAARQEACDCTGCIFQQQVAEIQGVERRGAKLPGASPKLKAVLTLTNSPTGTTFTMETVQEEKKQEPTTHKATVPDRVGTGIHNPSRPHGNSPRRVSRLPITEVLTTYDPDLIAFGWAKRFSGSTNLPERFEKTLIGAMKRLIDTPTTSDLDREALQARIIELTYEE